MLSATLRPVVAARPDRRAASEGDVDVATAPAVLTDAHDASAAALLALLRGLTRPPRAEPRSWSSELRGWDGSMAAGSAAAGTYAAVREAVVAALVAHPLLAPARAAAPPVHAGGARAVVAPAQPGRAGPARAGRRPDRQGSTSTALAVDALAQVAAMPPRTWGDRHRFAPCHAFADLGLDPSAYLPSVAGHPLDGDTECVASTAVDPRNGGLHHRPGRPHRVGPR